MRALGLPVPPGFTIPTPVCHRVLGSGWFGELEQSIRAGLAELESTLSRYLGSAEAPLLVSVRSGAPISMPGMMDTVLNVGMSAEVARALCRWSGDDRFGWETYLRFIGNFTTVVGQASENVVGSAVEAACGAKSLAELPVGDLPAAVGSVREGLAGAGYTIPDDPIEQVVAAIHAVFNSWQSDRATVYRRLENIPADLGTAATVQAMVFGNLGDNSGTGVAFTRDPSSGVPGVMGDFLLHAQGEDVVAGTHRTQPLSELGELWPDVATQLDEVAGVLERELRDMVDIEFTIENRKLWLLQARVGKRSPRAALRVAVNMANDPSFPVDRAKAVSRVAHLLDSPPTEEADNGDEVAVVLAEGLAASPGRAVGVVCFDPDAAVARAAKGEAVILVRPETSPADIHGIAEARGLVTTLGGLVSHAAVVARSWGLPAVVGAANLRLEHDAIVAGNQRVEAGEEITVDGDRGLVLLGAHPGQGMEMAEVRILRSWQEELEQTTPASGGGADEAQPGAGAGGASEALAPEACLRLLVLKGMATSDGLAVAAGVSVEAIVGVLDELSGTGHVQAGPGGRYLLTPEGTAAAEAAYASEAVEARPVIEPHLDRFHELNAQFKEIVTNWQMREVDGETIMNDHSDPDYDAAVISALNTDVHIGICEILAAVSERVDRLEGYRSRLEAALQSIADGALEMVAHPMKDSYHTVWFEMHEELIRLSGRNRADEARAGRA
jgi:pyruvate,orthophosphate dikinase